jgi:hypothetical protein
MLNDNLSLKSIFVDQIITGFEMQVLTPAQYKIAKEKYNSYGDAGKTRGQRIRINIKDSLHFKFLQDQSTLNSSYSDYVEFSEQLESHTVENYNKLIREFNLSSLKENPIQLQYLGKGEYQVTDGFHRLALYVWKTNKKHIPFEFVSGVTLNRVNLGEHRVSKALLRLLQKIHNQGFYNSWAIGNEFIAGYHGFDILGFKALGQRNNLLRVEYINSKVHLNDRRILDLGCNSGGFIFHIPAVEFALGIDFDKKSINFANNLVKFIKRQNPELSNRYSFIHRDIDKIQRHELTNLLIENEINLVCLLSMGSWLSNWKLIYSTVAMSGVDVLLETNNDEQGVDELNLFKIHGYTIQLISSESFDDNTGNIGRKTYFCTKD